MAGRWIDYLLRVTRLRLIGLTLGLAGISIVLSPTGAFGVTTYLQTISGIHPYVLGVLMALGGWLIVFMQPKLLPFLVSTLPWGLYAISSVLFVLQNHLSATIAIIYMAIYAAIFREALELE